MEQREKSFLPWHGSVGDLERILQTSKSGLAQEEALLRLKKFGPNRLPEPKSGGRLEIFLNQFKNPLVLILIAAAGVGAALGDFVDAGIILAALFINVVLGFYQEFKADKALAELKKLLQINAIVLRGGVPASIGAELLVPGDALVLSAGDRVPADARIFEAHNFSLNEAPLTGESGAVSKNTDHLPVGMPLPERNNMVFSGTTVMSGRALAFVTETGAKTEFGKVAAQVESVKDSPTPLQTELAALARMLGAIFLAVSFLIFVIGLLQGRTFIEMFVLSVAVAVAAVPEGLPLAVTAILAIGMQRILKRKALVRKLIAAETLGSVSVMCVDKTGTITEGEMRVSHIWTPGDSSEKQHEPGAEQHSSHIMALRIAMLCNDVLVKDSKDELKELVVLGDHLDRALFFAATEAGLEREKLLRESPRIDEIPFSEERRYMATLHKISVHNIIYIKGAPEILLKHCAYEFLGGRAVAMDEDSRRRIKTKISDLAKKGLRTVAVCYKLAGNMKSFSDRGVAVDDFVFAGILGMRDPVREGVAETLRYAGMAGIKTIMITGDHKETARAVAEEVGIPAEEKNIIDGAALDAMNDKELEERSKELSIYARVFPHHKIRIVAALRGRGEVVAMTGDGVNDAPALKGAHIGIALGSGTDVAKEVSDMVLLDDNVKTIVAAIEQGRIIFENIKKVVLYLLVSSFSEIIVITGSLFMRLPLPFLPAQILWVNLVEDSFPNMALAFDPGDRRIMKGRPYRGSSSVANGTMKYMIVIISLVTDTALFALFLFLIKTGYPIEAARTLMFVALGIDSLFFIYVIRSLRRPVWKTNPFSNPFITLSVVLGFVLLVAAVYVPFLQNVLQTVPLNLNEWTLLISIAILKMIFIELIKLIFVHKFNRTI